MTTTRTGRLIALGASVAVAVPMGLAIATPASAAVSAETADMLQWMVAEEKLAHDVYVTLGDLYTARQFDSIANSESRHQDAMRVLLDRYDVTDPTVGDAVGEFDDPTLQKLYNDLVKQGSVSLVEAAQVGIAIERLDIADLKEALADNSAADIEAVLNNLMAGSEKHLAAFTRLADGDTAVGTGQQAGRGGQGTGQQAGRGGQGTGRGAKAAGQNTNASGTRDGSCLTTQ